MRAPLSPENREVKTLRRKNPKVGFVSLGCPKALVDSERILTRLRAEGYEVAPSYQAADLVVVNTCGFIDAAVDESLDAIGEALAENGKVIVTGCLGAQPQKILDRHPQVLKITGAPALRGGPRRRPRAPAAEARALRRPRARAGHPPDAPATTRTLKISEGCNHRCSFCIIPSLRGDLVSRPIADVMREAEALARSGVKEILVVSQDTSAYGVDLKYAPGEWRGRERRTRFYDLAAALGELGVWIRLHYVYPYPHVDEVVDLMAAGRVLPYLDVPFQHASTRILKLMKRPAAAANTLERIRAWRRTAPDIAIRSTFTRRLSGRDPSGISRSSLPGCTRPSSTASAAFEYSPVAGAAANDLKQPAVPGGGQDRAPRALHAAGSGDQRGPPRRQGRPHPRRAGGPHRGRCRRRPLQRRRTEIDGTVRIRGAGLPAVGELVPVEITAAGDYDLEARARPRATV